MENFFKNKKPSVPALLNYGFLREGENFIYRTGVADGQFTLTVTVCAGQVKTDLFDNSSGGEYTLYRVEGAGGEFVGFVRRAVEEELKKISEKCYTYSVFNSRGAVFAVDFAKKTYGDELEFLWEKLDAAVLRKKSTGKWYTVLMKVPAKKFGREGEEVEIIDVRYPAEELPVKADGKKYFLGYHMNKKHWLTLILEDAEEGEIEELLSYSYSAAK